MRKLNRYCLLRQQVKMSWNPLNCFNITARKPLNERHLNLFQIEWKSKALCRLYFNGDITERSFKAVYNNQGRNIHETIAFMERRIDNILFRCLFASSIYLARKMASAGQVMVNGARVWTPSFTVSDGDLIQIFPPAISHVMNIKSHSMLRIWGFVPEYLEVNRSNLSAVFLRQPRFEEIPSPYPRTMVENMGAFYSKRG